MAQIWYWRYGVPSVQEVDDAEWAEVFHCLTDGGDCSVDGVELGDTYLTFIEALRTPEVKTIESRERERFDAQMAAEKATRRVRVEVRHPTGKDWALVAAVPAEEGDKVAAEFTAKFGPDRVRVTKISR